MEGRRGREKRERRGIEISILAYTYCKREQGGKLKDRVEEEEESEEEGEGQGRGRNINISLYVQQK